MAGRDGLLGDMTEDTEHKPQVIDAEEKKDVQDDGAGEEIEDTTGDGSHTPSSQQLERPEGKMKEKERKRRLWKGDVLCVCVCVCGYVCRM